MNNTLILLSLFGLSSLQSQAAVFAEDTDIGSSLLFDGNAGTGGGDHNTGGNSFFTRTWAALNVGVGGTTVTITGLAFGLPGGGNTDGSTMTATINYFGLDGASGGGDDVLIGSTGATLDYTTGAGYYGWVFDSPLEATIDGANTVFSVQFQSNNGMRFKTTSGSGAAAVKMNVAGSSVAVVPEPAGALLGALGLFGLLRRRR